ncbi:hypothetical protein GH714_022887 [Hevea brasiliensis]|uniref:non-specific serine/threonine protein kinase n=1 Tax=Hevea brasiliensis TaxID=3981 RepID=A0A6A6KKV4_HEVBR|nr:hypothetical protein GH714_022887 [Hevea brasiliensis]
MASKPSAGTSPEKQRKAIGNQTPEGKFRRPSPLQITKTSKSEPVTPRKPPQSAQVASKHVSVVTTEDNKSLISQKSDNVNSLVDKVSSSLAFVDPKQGLTCADPEGSDARDSPESTTDKKSKNLQNEIGASSAEVSDGTSSIAKTSGSAKISEKADFVESGKSSANRGSTSSDVSDESTCSSLSSSVNKPHKANDMRWEAIQAVRAKDGVLGVNHFRLLKRLGCGDIGSVYLSELSGTKCYFAMKVMDKASLASRKKLLRAQTEREILQCLDHPFLPTLYTHFETDKFSCLVMEFCPGGDLHTLRQRQPGKHFSERAVKFYIAEVLLALEYLHMLGIVYRDLKPENVLVREDGHIMLSDFDLSLRCAVSPTLVKSSAPEGEHLRKNPAYCVQPACIEPSCIQPSCVAPTTCFSPRIFLSKSRKDRKPKNEMGNQVTPLPELIAEPTDARSMSFGCGNRATLFNVVGLPLRFPESPVVSFSAKDLIRGLLVKEPQHRLAYKRGATEIKQHPFFEGVNWALIRCASPPEIPRPPEIEHIPASPSTSGKGALAVLPEQNNYLEFDFF